MCRLGMQKNECGVIDYLRKPKVFDMALFDWIGSLLAAWIVGRFVLRLSSAVAWIVFVMAWVAFGVLVHWALGIDSMFGYYLGVSKKPERKQC